MTLISVHLPKTAGTSFKASLAAHFGDRYRDDYGDKVISQSRHERFKAAISAGVLIARQGLDGIDCVHGHFLPMKFQQLDISRSLTFVTWMREPVARLLSHYDYWQESYDKETAAPHHRKVIEEGWTLERFCLSKQFRNIYTQYLWGFPLEMFSFIGITEHYNDDMREFSARFLSADIPPQHLNAAKYSRSSRSVDEAFLEEVRVFHAADIRLYQRALQLRRERHRGDRLDHRLNNIVPFEVHS